jgi:hypothetical protein
MGETRMSSEDKLTRRDFLKLGIAAGCTAALGGCTTVLGGERASSSPHSNVADRNELRGFNVHPYPGELMTLQLQALKEIRANWVRITLGITTDSAGAYATATGANVLGLISDFRLKSIDKHAWPDMVATVIQRYPSIQYFQILNEPEHFFGISNREYVTDYLRPAHDVIRSTFPYVKIVSASPMGVPSGIQDFKTMSDAGADQYCDFRAVHIYFTNGIKTFWSTPWSAFRKATSKPIMVTETGKRRPSQHLAWWREQIPKIKQALKTEYVFYYALLEQPVYTGYEIIRAERDSQGNVVPAPGSELYNYLRS